MQKMQTIPNLFQSKNKTYSFELFPPKTDKGFENLKETIGQLARLKPDFFSCTYGAGGGGRDKTFDIVQYIEQEHHIIAMAHLTCVLNTKNDIKNIPIPKKILISNNLITGISKGDKYILSEPSSSKNGQRILIEAINIPVKKAINSSL